MSAFGTWLKEQMDARGWDLQQMQKKSTVSDANLSRYITKGTRPSWAAQRPAAGRNDATPPAASGALPFSIAEPNTSTKYGRIS